MLPKVLAAGVVAAGEMGAAGAVADDAEVVALGLTTSSPAAKPKFLTGADAVGGLTGADFVSAAGSVIAGVGGVTVDATGALNTGAAVLALVVPGVLPTAPTKGKLVTILTAISLLIVFGLLSKIRGNPTTAISTKTAAPIKRWRAR